MTRYYDEFAIGEETDLGSHAFELEAIVAFARRWDPQRFHIVPAAAADSIFGTLVASGWHTACVAMRKMVDARIAEKARRVAAGLPTPSLGVSPGVRNLRWPVPVVPGDVVTYRSQVISMRETKRPQWGLVASRTSAFNARGQEVFSMEGSVFAARRGA